MTDAVTRTLASVLDDLRRAARERKLGELVESAAWWLDVQTGTARSKSPWALSPSDCVVNSGRLSEAPYLAAIGYVVAVGAIAADSAMADAAARVLRRTPHTLERTGYADDPLVLGGLMLLERALQVDPVALRDEGAKFLASPQAPSSIAGLLTLIEPSLAASCRPYNATDSGDASVAIVMSAADEQVRSRLFPAGDVDELRKKLMTDACTGALSPGSELDRAFAAIALASAITNMASSTSRAPTKSMTKQDAVDIAIVVALKEEFRQVHACLPNATPIELAGHQYYRARIGDYSIVTAFVGDMGPVAAAIASSRLIERWQPRNVVLLGIAGGLSKDVALGDVVVASQVDSYLDAGKAVDGERSAAEPTSEAAKAPGNDTFTLQPSGAVFRGDRQLVSRVRNFEFTHAALFQRWQETCRARRAQQSALADVEDAMHETALHDGIIASGPLVGASDKFRAWLSRRERAYKALEMEGGAVMWASEQSWDPPHTLVVRGISDRANPAKAELDDTSKGAVRAWAMQNAIAFVWMLIEAGLLEQAD